LLAAVLNKERTIREEVDNNILFILIHTTKTFSFSPNSAKKKKKKKKKKKGARRSRRQRKEGVLIITSSN